MPAAPPRIFLPQRPERRAESTKSTEAFLGGSTTSSEQNEQLNVSRCSARLDAVDAETQTFTIYKEGRKVNCHPSPIRNSTHSLVHGGHTIMVLVSAPY